MRLPTQSRSRTPSGHIFAGTSSVQRVCTLSGFSKSEAILASSLFGPMPTLTVKPSSLRMRFLSSVATATGSCRPRCRLISRKHSSIENFWRTGEYARQMAVKRSEQLLYQAQSPRTITRPGQVRRAIEMGWAVLMPSFLAGIDAAVTMLRRSDGSPETTEGTRRMSSPPSRTCLTALQDRNAELTSMWKMTRFIPAGRLAAGFSCRCLRSPGRRASSRRWR